jgi:guanylate kinase
MTKFLLLLGTSGVGKSAVIDELSKLDSQFVYISPYMTRSLRVGEKNKVVISDEQMDEMWQNGELLTVNELYGGIRYGTPKLPIEEALATGKFPVLDWPINRLEIMAQAFPSRLFIVYISPPSISILHQRLAKDGRDIDGLRLEGAKQELLKYWSSEYVGLYDLEVVSQDNKLSEVATTIYINYLESFKEVT